MSDDYTDDDVREAECAIGLNGRSLTCTLCTSRECACPKHAARTALRAVAPAIVARAKAEALREAAGAIFNGASDPEQEFYDAGVSPWLMRRADEIEATR